MLFPKRRELSKLEPLMMTPALAAIKAECNKDFMTWKKRPNYCLFYEIIFLWALTMTVWGPDVGMEFNIFIYTR